MHVKPCKIHENSYLARMAAYKLNSNRIAITLGNHIYLWNADRETFLNTTAWVNHELCHVRQFRHYGFFRFLWLYLIESAIKGYYNNKFEKEARAAELKTGLIKPDYFLSC